jgi:hypothetical protein
MSTLASLFLENHGGAPMSQDAYQKVKASRLKRMLISTPGFRRWARCLDNFEARNGNAPADHNPDAKVAALTNRVRNREKGKPFDRAHHGAPSKKLSAHATV